MLYKRLPVSIEFIKGLDIFFREKSLGSFAVDVFQPSPDVEKIQELTNKLYVNLIDKNTNNRKIAETLGNLDVIFKINKNSAVRLLARTITKWYKNATDLYMKRLSAILQVWTVRE